MRHSEIAKKLGPASLKIDGGLLVQVMVLDYKNCFGNDCWLVTPVSGSGEKFVKTGTLLWEDN